MRPHEVYLSLASNIEPERNITRALDLLAARLDLTGLATCLQTDPIDRPEQPHYINTVLRARTDLEPRPLKFDCLRQIEDALGRVRSSDAYAARTIDLDILLYDSLVIDEPGLRIPDPHIVERPFLAAALLELAPGLVMPDTGRRLAEYVQAGACSPSMNPLAAFTERLKERHPL